MIWEVVVLTVVVAQLMVFAAVDRGQHDFIVSQPSFEADDGGRGCPQENHQHGTHDHKPNLDKQSDIYFVSILSKAS